MNRLARYPVEYSQILLALDPDGHPLDITVADEATAQRERLQFYNFLKFLRRNPSETAHFGNRHNLVTISIHGNVLRFFLRSGQGSSLAQGLRQSLNNAAGITSLPTRVAADVSDQVHAADLVPGLEELSDPDPFGALEKHLRDAPPGDKQT